MQPDWIHSDTADSVDPCVKVYKISASLLGCKSNSICQAENLLTGLKSEKKVFRKSNVYEKKQEEGDNYLLPLKVYGL
jgi:hypothetical protein